MFKRIESTMMGMMYMLRMCMMRRAQNAAVLGSVSI